MVKNIAKQIQGKWEIESNFCGICPVANTNYQAGNGNILVFFEDGRFERFLNNVTVFIGKYELKKSTVCDNPANDIELTTSEIPSTGVLFIKLNEGKLVLSTPNCYLDGGWSTYRRIR